MNNEANSKIQDLTLLVLLVCSWSADHHEKLGTVLVHWNPVAAGIESLYNEKRMMDLPNIFKNNPVKLFLMILALSLRLAAPCSAVIYQWTDDNHQVHFTDNPRNIPAPYRDRVKNFDQMEHRGSAIFVPGLGNRPAGGREDDARYMRWIRRLQGEHQKKSNPAPMKVILYSADW